jgi:hypothetical protein
MSTSGRPSYVDLLDANHYLQKAADSFYFMCTTRTVQESKLYPVSPYIAMSYLNAWYRWPELLRKVDAAMPAEEIGDRARQVGTYTNIVTASLIPNFYLGGREILLDMGLLKPTDALEDVMFVLDFSRRLSLSYQRASAHMLPSDASYKMQLHTARQTEAFEAAALGVTPGDELHAAFARFMAAMSTYGFLSHCECRLSFCNHGPYRTKGGDEMLVRDAVDLAECDYPWMDGVAGEIEHNNVTVTVILKDTHFNMVDDWGSFEAKPSYDLDNLVALGVYTSDWLSDGYIPVHMDNAADLAAFLDDQSDKMERATARMWTMMAGWTREQMVDAGTLVYYAGVKEVAHFAGVYEQDDWFLIDDRAEVFKPLMNDEYGGSLIAEIVGLVSLGSQQRGPAHMARYSEERGEMWTPIPYSVLADDVWTAHVGPIAGGATTLPPKTAKWTTTRGKLTEDECNAAARDFGSPLHDLRHYDDDGWRKFNPEDERTRKLFDAADLRARALPG